MPHRNGHLALEKVRHAAAPAPARPTADEAPAAASISQEGLQALAALVTTRLDGPEELRRLALVDEALQAAQRLGQALTTLTRHSIVEYRGSHGAWDVRADADAAFVALRDCAGALVQVARADLRVTWPPDQRP